MDASLGSEAAWEELLACVPPGNVPLLLDLPKVI